MISGWWRGTLRWAITRQPGALWIDAPSFCFTIGYLMRFDRAGLELCWGPLPKEQRRVGMSIWRHSIIWCVPFWPFSFVRLNDTPIALIVSWTGRDGWRYSKSFYFPFWRRWAR